jgi:hypothetical protein
MKVAFCFYGLVGGKSKKFGLGEQLDPSNVYRYYKKNVFSQVEEYDVFIHSQSFSFKEKLIKLYKPKSFKIEKQKNFSLKVFSNIFFIKFLISVPYKLFYNILINKKYSINIKKKFLRCKNNYSRWYSTKKSVELMNNYCNKKRIRYDLVLLTRFDVAFLTPFKFNKIDKKKITVPNHNDVPSPRNNYKGKFSKTNKTFKKGISDFWFLSNPENIIKFSKLYDRLGHYLMSSHMSSLQHVRYLGINLNFFRFRGKDHEAIRRLNRSEE